MGRQRPVLSTPSPVDYAETPEQKHSFSLSTSWEGLNSQCSVVQVLQEPHRAGTLSYPSLTKAHPGSESPITHPQSHPPKKNYLHTYPGVLTQIISR